MRVVRRFALGVVLAACLAGGAGCNVVGPVFLAVHGPEKAPALFTLDKERTAVIFVDDRGNRLPRRVLRVQMALEAEKVLLKRRLVKDMISGQSALQASAADRGGKLLSIAEIGRAVEAQQVIYAAIEEYTLTPDGQTFVPSLTLRVKVVDAINDKRVWPEDRAGHPVIVRLGSKQGSPPPAGSAERARVEDELAAAAGTALARVFYKHEVPKGPNAPES